MPNIDVASMMNALTSLQNNVFNNTETSNKSPTEIKHELIKQLHKLDTDSIDKKVNQKDEDTIDLVGMLFQFIVIRALRSLQSSLQWHSLSLKSSALRKAQVYRTVTKLEK